MQNVGTTILATVLSVIVTLVVTLMFNKLIALPAAIKKQKEEELKAVAAKEKAERDAAIKAAEARKLAQPGLKRWFEKMLGRDKIDYNQMSTTEIHSLWQTEKRGKK